jgi:hypothetical protein
MSARYFFVDIVGADIGILTRHVVEICGTH